MNYFSFCGISEKPYAVQNLRYRLFATFLFLLFATAMFAQPANDEPANAVALTLGAAGVSATVNGATDSFLDLCENGFYDEDDDIFYTFVAPASGKIDVEFSGLTGSGDDPIISVLAGTVGSLSCYDFSLDLTSSYTGLSNGVTYFLQISSLNSSPSQRVFDVSVSETPAPPANDECANASPLTVGAATSGTIAGATDSFKDPCGNGISHDDVWYSFVATATESSVYVDRTGGSDPGLRVGVHSGSCVSLTSMACNVSGGESLNLTGLSIGSKYYIQVFSNASSGAESTTFDIEVLAPPTNDACSNATSLACAASVTNSYRGSTPSTDASCVARGVWYSVTGTGGSITLDVSPTANNDVAMSIYTGSCGSLTEYVCEDVAFEGEDESFEFISLADETYYIYIGESFWLDDNEGAFTLDITCASLPSVAVASGCNSTVTSVNLTGSGEWLPILLGTNAVGKIKDTESLGVTTISLYGHSGALRTAGSPFANRNITINPASSPSLTIPVRLYYTAAEINALITADASVSSIADLQFTKVSGTSCSGAYPGGGVQLPNTATGSFGSNYYVQTSVAAFSEFFLSSSAAPLPVELASFSAYAKTRVNHIEWQTASERNVDYFRIERSSDGSSFIEIGEVLAIGESSTLQSYAFVDEAPLNKAYYRLVSVDLDATESTSDLVFVEQVLAKAVIVQAYPNPTSGVLNVVSKEGATVQLIDATGRLLEERHQRTSAIQFDAAQYPSGVYFIRVMEGTGSTTKQVVFK